MPLCFVCVVTVGFGQVNEVDRDASILRTNVSGYGTSLIKYQLSNSVICKDTEKLKLFIREFNGVQEVAISGNDILIEFSNVQNSGQLDLLFERVEMLYLTTKNTQQN